jgi:hypothetical protein
VEGHDHDETDRTFSGDSFARKEFFRKEKLGDSSAQGSGFFA